MSEDRALFSDRMLEGEYTTWTQVWARDYGAFVNIDEVYVDNFGRCYASDGPAGNEYVRDYDGTEQNIVGYYFYPIAFTIATSSVSLTHKYVLDNDSAFNYIVRIWRWGAVIWTLDTSLLDPDYGGVYVYSLSPNGKFLAIVSISIFTGDQRYLMLYEGT